MAKSETEEIQSFNALIDTAGKKAFKHTSLLQVFVCFSN